MQSLLELRQIVDLDRYPVDGDADPRNALVEATRAQLRADGVALLPGFVRSDAVAFMAAEARKRSGGAFLCDDTHNVYLTDTSEFGTDHVGNRELRTWSGRSPTTC